MQSPVTIHSLNTRPLDTRHGELSILFFRAADRPAGIRPAIPPTAGVRERGGRGPRYPCRPPWFGLAVV